MTARIQLDTFNGRGSQHHLKNPKTKAEELALIAGGNKVRTQATPITRAEELENARAARAKAARASKAKITLDTPAWAK